jgi:hypothetical protein
MQNESAAVSVARELLRHTVATLAYRGGKALRDTPPGFSDFHAPAAVRTPGQILAHLGDLLDWALAMAQGKPAWHDSQPLAWEQGVSRFFAALQTFDAYLASGEPLAYPAGKLFQGPVADALTHVGQIAILRRLAGAPIRGENYFQADIAVGRAAPQQSLPRREFDG